MHPIVLVPAGSQVSGAHRYHAVQHKYVDAVVVGADCAPLILPALADGRDLDAMLDICDGVLLTGAASNLDARYYGQVVLDPTLPQDAARDATTMSLIPAVLARGMPLLAICRGLQELNVALGGSLHQAVHLVEGKFDHRENPAHDLAEQYAAAHSVQLCPGGLLHRLLGREQIAVNSLHGQGLDRLAAGLTVEAWAADGLVEAFTVTSAAGFTLALQWHPEWQLASNPVSMTLFQAFGQACRRYHTDRAASQTERQ